LVALKISEASPAKAVAGKSNNAKVNNFDNVLFILNPNNNEHKVKETKSYDN
jgi:hypothetical protein